MSRRQTLACSPAIVAVALAIGIPHAQSEDLSPSEREGKRLFTTETFGGNGRTCATCHSLETGTVSHLPRVYNLLGCLQTA